VYLGERCERVVKVRVIKIQPERLQAVEKMLNSSEAVTLRPRNPYEAFRFRCDDGTVIGYSTGKIVSSGEGAYRLLVKVVRAVELQGLKTGIVIGSDEAGKGEWLGPLTVAAVGLTPLQALDLRLAGVMDSKELPANKLQELEENIKRLSSAWHVVLVSPTRFNALLKDLKDEGKGLNDLLAWGHAKAISEVYKKIRAVASAESVKVVVDEFDRFKMRERLGRVVEMGQIGLVQKPRAEEEIPVAAASVLARQARERWVDEASEMFGVKLREISAGKALSLSFIDEIAKLGYLKKIVKR